MIKKNTKNILSQFTVIDTEEKAYWLGFLCADGSVSTNEDKIELGLAEKDLDYLEKFKKFMNLPNKICYRASTKSYRFSFRSQNLKADLIKLGCVPQKSLILQFPSFEQVPKHLIRHFMRGYFDGDGWFSNTFKAFEVGILGTQDFVENYINLLGLNKINKIHNTKTNTITKKYVSSAVEDVTIWLDFIYKDAKVYLNRKYEKYLDFLKNGKRKNNCRLL